MRRDYDEQPDIPPFLGVEQGVQQFWDASLAWKGRPGSKKRYTVGRIFEVLSPLRTNIKSAALREQADGLAQLVVAYTIQRPSNPESEVVQLADLRKKRQERKTRNSGSREKAA